MRKLDANSQQEIFLTFTVDLIAAIQAIGAAVTVSGVPETFASWTSSLKGKDAFTVTLITTVSAVRITIALICSRNASASVIALEL